MPPKDEAAKGATKKVAAPPDIMAMVQAELEGLRFVATPNIHQVLQDLARRIVKDLRPGRGLLGNNEEEAKLSRVKDEDEKIETSGTGDIEMADVQTSDAKFQSDEEQMDGACFEEHKAPVGKVIYDDEGEALGEYEAESFGHSYVKLPDGKEIAIWEYLGPDWDARIEKLYSIKPLEMPKHMRITPRDFQLKVAAQGLHCLLGPHRLFLLGDEMGVGKTLSSILMMWALKDRPGMSIVICPKNLCETWLETIHIAFDEGHALQALVLNDHSITQAQLLAGGYDIIVCSYEFFEANGRDMHTFHSRIAEKANDQEGTVVLPRRPTSALHSRMWKILNMPFKIAVLDEAQRVNKRGTAEHEALRRHLYASSFLILSGTLPHSKWHDIFLHAFPSFNHSSQIERPSDEKLRLLQKFLQAFFIARPASILNLKNCQNRMVAFKLLETEEKVVSYLTLQYQRVAGISDKVPGIDPRDAHSRGFRLAVTALMASLHPMLAEAAEKKEIRLRDFSQGGVNEGLQDMVKDDLGGEARDQWLQDICNRQDIVEESGRLTTLMRLYTWLRKTYPDEKMIIFSSFLRYLDIVAEALRRDHSVTALRCDRTVPPNKRKAVEQAFAKCNPACPLLITMNPGKSSTCGVGLNLQPGSIVILGEPQWNNNVVLQAIARVYRPGQTKTVKAMIMHAVNSEIDHIVLATSRRKHNINLELMRPLVRTPDQGPASIELLTVH